MAIIAASDYKTWKGISATTWDAQLVVMVPAAQAVAERFCGRSFDEATFTETVSGNGSPDLFLTNTPIASITSIKYIADDGTETTVDSTGYRFDPDTGVVHRHSGADGWAWGCGVEWTEGFRNYKAVYVAGYSDAGTVAPADLKAALYQLIDLWLADSPGGGLGPQFQSEALADYSYTRFETAQEFDAIRAALMPYRRGLP